MAEEQRPADLERLTDAERREIKQMRVEIQKRIDRAPRSLRDSLNGIVIPMVTLLERAVFHIEDLEQTQESILWEQSERD